MFRRLGKNRRQVVDLRPGSVVEVVGESFYQKEISEVCGGRKRNARHIQLKAILHPEVGNPYDQDAVAVLIKNRKVGHLSRENAARYRPLLDRMASGGEVARCDAVVVGGWDRGDDNQGSFGVRLDLLPPEHAHPESPTPSLLPNASPREDRRSAHTGTTSSPRLEAGSVRGRHFTDWVDPVKEMKREKRYPEVLELLYELCAAAEAEAAITHQTLPPWYFEQVAIEERRASRPDLEVSILERYSNSPFAIPGQFDERLSKALMKLPPPPNQGR